jgi:aminopeptidase N
MPLKNPFMKKFLVLIALGAVSYVSAQQQPEQAMNRGAGLPGVPVKINDLVHTKLDAKFDYNHSYLNGKVWLTLKPHFDPTDSLQLDAKGMNINRVELVGQVKISR